MTDQTDVPGPTGAPGPPNEASDTSPPPQPWQRLTIRAPVGGGRVAVATDRLFTRIEALESLVAATSNVRRSLDDSWARGRWLMAPATLAAAATADPAGTYSSFPLDDAIIRVDEAARAAARLAGDLRNAARAYGDAERRAGAFGRLASDQVAWLLGRLAPVYLPMIATTTFGLFALGSILPADDRKLLAAGLARKLADNGWVINNPVTVSLLRSAVMGADDFENGMAGIPLPVDDALGDSGAQVLGVHSAASSLVALLGAAGLLREAGVGVAQVGRAEPTVAAVGVADRAARIPEQPDTGNEPQIRIDRYRTIGRPDRFEVYVAGTKDFGLRAGAEPFDMTSNVSGMARQSPASYRAVVMAMREAGVTPTSPVTLTGYSQGGLVTALVAASGEYDVKAMTTFGAPLGQVAIPSDVSVLTVRHAEDIVPALGGDDVDSHSVVVQRAVFDHRSVPPGKLVAAHELGFYAQTAQLVDASGSTELRSKLDVLDHFAAGTNSVKSTLWRATRDVAGVAPGGSANEPR